MRNIFQLMWLLVVCELRQVFLKPGEVLRTYSNSIQEVDGCQGDITQQRHYVEGTLIWRWPWQAVVNLYRKKEYRHNPTLNLDYLERN